MSNAASPATNQRCNRMIDAQSPILMLQFLRAAYWFDEAVRKERLARDARLLPRAQSVLMMNVVLGRRKSTQLAEAMGVSRQAVSRIIGDLVDAKMLKTSPDPDDGRGMLVDLDESNLDDAEFLFEAMRSLESRLGQIIGEDRLAVLRTALAMDWGEPSIPDESGSEEKRP